jgi:hypothetical protein
MQHRSSDGAGGGDGDGIDTDNISRMYLVSFYWSFTTMTTAGAYPRPLLSST